MYYYWLHNVPGIGRRSMQTILKYISAKGLYESNSNQLEKILNEKQVNNVLRSKSEWKINIEWEILQRKKIQVIGLLEKEYPTKLRQINDPPPILYVKGKKDIFLLISYF